MKFAEKCPKCGGEIQTKNLKKFIGLGIVDIPVAQFCLNPVCSWYQDFSEAARPDDIKEDVLQIKIPKTLKKLELQIADLIKQNRFVVKGVIVVVVLWLLLIWILQSL